MNPLAKTLLVMAYVVGAALALLFSGENMSVPVMGPPIVDEGLSASAESVGFVAYLMLTLAIAIVGTLLGAVAAWVLFGKRP